MRGEASLLTSSSHKELKFKIHDNEYCTLLNEPTYPFPRRGSIPRRSWLAGSVWRCPLPFWWSFYRVDYPSFFVFLFVGSFCSLCFHGLGAPHHAPCTAKIQKNYPFPKLTLALTSHLWQNDGLGEG